MSSCISEEAVLNEILPLGIGEKKEYPLNTFDSELIFNLCTVCADYQQYLKEKNEGNTVENRYSDQNIVKSDQKKIEVLDQLINILLKPQICVEDKLMEFKDSFLVNKSVLEVNTDTIGRKFLNFMKTILSFGFWRSTQERFLQKGNELTVRNSR